jgi:hypothetical protein
MSMTFRRISFLTAPFSLALLCLGLTGCGLTVRQQAAISKFSATTAALAGQVEDNLVQTRNDVVALRTGMLALDAGTVDLENSSADLDAGLNVDELETRLKAAGALKRFGMVLETLATDTQTGELQAASDQFVASLRQVQGVNLSDAKAEAIGQVISKVGGLWINAKRKKALKMVIVETRQPLQMLADLVAKDFIVTNEQWLAVLTATQDEITDSLKSQMEFVAEGKHTNPEDDKSPKWKESEVTLRQDRYQALKLDAAARVKRAELISERMLRSVAGFRGAHDDLFVIIQSDKVTLEKIDGYYTEIDSLIRLSKILAAKERK